MTEEMFASLMFFLKIIVGVVVLDTLLLLVSITLEVVLYRRISERDFEILGGIKVMKEYANSAKSHSSDAKAALQEVVDKVKPGSDEAVAAVAEKVLTKIAESGGAESLSKRANRPD